MLFKNAFIPILSEHPFFCLPESVGWYGRWPEHFVGRDKGEWNTFSIHIVVDGKGYVDVDDRQYTLVKGDCYLYFPNQRQLYYSSKDEPWELRWVHFYGGSELTQFLIDRGFHRSSIWTLKDWSSFEQLYHDLLTEAEKHEAFHYSRLSYLTYGIIAEFVSNAIPLTTNKGTEVSDRLLKLLPQIQKQAHLPFILEEWAEQAEISQYYFCRLFRKLTQLSPLEFVTLCRLQKAKQLLIEKKEWSIKRIAIESGYINANYFNKKFLAHEGMTPTEYRQKH